MDISIVETNVLSIEKVQNFELYKSYQAKKVKLLDGFIALLCQDLQSSGKKIFFYSTENLQETFYSLAEDAINFTQLSIQDIIMLTPTTLSSPFQNDQKLGYMLIPANKRLVSLNLYSISMYGLIIKPAALEKQNLEWLNKLFVKCDAQDKTDEVMMKLDKIFEDRFNFSKILLIIIAVIILIIAFLVVRFIQKKQKSKKGENEIEKGVEGIQKNDEDLTFLSENSSINNCTAYDQNSL